jgi:hypothetical protein
LQASARFFDSVFKINHVCTPGRLYSTNTALTRKTSQATERLASKLMTATSSQHVEVDRASQHDDTTHNISGPKTAQNIFVIIFIAIYAVCAKTLFVLTRRHQLPLTATLFASAQHQNQ